MRDWRDTMTPEETKKMEDFKAAVDGNRGQVRLRSSATRVFSHNGEKVVEEAAPARIANVSMFPFHSMQMAVDPSEVQAVQEDLRRNHGLFIDFDKQGQPEVTSTAQHDKLAKAMGMKSGRDGFGHTDEEGRFQSSGRRQNDVAQAGRSQVHNAIDELNSMPEEVPVGAIDAVLNKCGLASVEENTK